MNDTSLLSRVSLDGSPWYARIELSGDALHVLPQFRLTRLHWAAEAALWTSVLLLSEAAGHFINGTAFIGTPLSWGGPLLLAAVVSRGLFVHRRQQRQAEAVLSEPGLAPLHQRLLRTPGARSLPLSTLSLQGKDDALRIDSPTEDRIVVLDEHVSGVIRGALAALPSPSAPSQLH